MTYPNETEIAAVMQRFSMDRHKAIRHLQARDAVRAKLGLR